MLERVEGLEQLVRSNAAEAERMGQVAPAVIDAFHDAELFSVLIPADHGGSGLTLPESVELFERVARFDASTAWTLVILADGPMLARSFADDVFAAICAAPKALIAGTLNPVTARAEQIDGGYVFSGTASYLSGSAYASWVLASALMTRDGELAFNDGRVEIRCGLIPIDRATSLDSWNVTGMRATGSSDYAFADVKVEASSTFSPFDPRPASGADVCAAIPLWAKLGGGLAAVAVGTARNMLDRFLELAAAKVPTGNITRLSDRGSTQIAVGEAFGLCQAARAVLMQTVHAIWARGAAGESFGPLELAEQRIGLVTAVRLAARSIDLLHDAAGMNAVTADDVLDRCWRDVHTMTQHVMLSPARYEIAGRVMLGLDPGAPMI